MNLDWILKQGADFARVLTLYEDNGSPMDLTGSVIRYQARNGIAGAAVLDLDNATKGGITHGGTSGTVQVAVTPAISSALSLVGIYDSPASEVQIDGSTATAFGALLTHGLEVVLADGRTKRVFDGKLCISREVVR